MAVVKKFWSVLGMRKSALARAEPDAGLLRVAGSKMLHAAHAHGHRPSLAVLQLHDLPELQQVFGPVAAERAVGAVLAGLAKAAGDGGLVVRTTEDTFALLVPDGGTAAAAAAIQASFGAPCTVEFEFERDEILVVPDVAAHPVGPQDHIDRIYRKLCRYIARTRGPQPSLAEWLPIPARRPAQEREGGSDSRARCSTLRMATVSST